MLHKYFPPLLQHSAAVPGLESLKILFLCSNTYWTKVVSFWLYCSDWPSVVDVQYSCRYVIIYHYYIYDYVFILKCRCSCMPARSRSIKAREKTPETCLQIMYYYIMYRRPKCFDTLWTHFNTRMCALQMQSLTSQTTYVFVQARAVLNFCL